MDLNVTEFPLVEKTIWKIVFIDQNRKYDIRWSYRTRYSLYTKHLYFVWNQMLLVAILVITILTVTDDNQNHISFRNRSTTIELAPLHLVDIAF